MYLLPKPKQAVFRKETLCLDAEGWIFYENVPGMESRALFLKELLCRETGFSYEPYPVPAGTRQNGTEVRFAGYTAWRPGSVVLSVSSGLKPQQYVLSVRKDGIELTGGDTAAVLYGIQTLRQILAQEGAVLSLAEIRDEPDLLVRGFFQDVTRGRVPKLCWLKRLADTMSAYKLNQLQLYIEHSYLFAGMTEVWRDDTPLTAAEIRELDRYCAERGIELVPSLASFGHLYKLLSTKQYRRHCELPDAGEGPFSFIGRMEHHTLDAADEEGIALIRSLLTEYMELFSSRRFNIGADETFDLGKGKNLARAQKEGVSGLYMDYVCSLCRFLIGKGRQPMLWGDVMLEFPELASRLPEGTICLNWGYAPDQSEDSTRTYAQNGVRQYACPGVLGWNHLINLQRDAYENISRMSAYAVRYGCEGLLNTAWGDYGHINDPEFGIPGMICGAAAAWNRDALPDYDMLNRQISVLEYRDRTETLTGLTGRLSEQETFGWYEAVWYKERWRFAKDGGRSELEALRPRIETASEKETEIRACMEKLTACISGMDLSCRDRVYPYLLAAEGIRIFNEIGGLLLDGNRDHELAFETAARLEAWYYRYRLRWGMNNRESELYRIGEVVNWYADLLRS